MLSTARLEGQVALVTGAGGPTGIGIACARLQSALSDWCPGCRILEKVQRRESNGSLLGGKR